MAIVAMVLTVLGHGLSETYVCRAGGEAGSADYEAPFESHCACTQESEKLPLTGSLLIYLADCSDGCACLPVRTGWQSSLPNRVKDDSRGKQVLARAARDHSGAHPAHGMFSPVIAAPAHKPPPLDSVLFSIRTIVLLT